MRDFLLDGVVDTTVRANLHGIRNTLGQDAVLVHVWLEEKVYGLLVRD
jgi:hypothetical protein